MASVYATHPLLGERCLRCGQIHAAGPHCKPANLVEPVHDFGGEDMPTPVSAPLPVLGYTPQSDENTALANELKVAEERYLRILDKLGKASRINLYFLSLARTHMQTANMFAVRSIFQPTRIALPEDTNNGGAV